MARKRSGELPFAVRRAPYHELIIYEITEAELEELERGSPDSIFLNFAILFLSVFASFFASLITASFSSDRTFLIFVVVTVVSGASGIVLLVLWIFSRRRVSSLVGRIRDRLPPLEGIQAPTEIVPNSNDSPQSDEGSPIHRPSG